MFRQSSCRSPSGLLHPFALCSLIRVGPSLLHIRFFSTMKLCTSLSICCALCLYFVVKPFCSDQIAFISLHFFESSYFLSVPMIYGGRIQWVESSLKLHVSNRNLKLPFFVFLMLPCSVVYVLTVAVQHFLLLFLLKHLIVAR